MMDIKPTVKGQTVLDYFDEYVDFDKLVKHNEIEFGVNETCPFCRMKIIKYHNCHRGLLFRNVKADDGVLIYLTRVQLVRTDTSWKLVCRAHANCLHVNQGAKKSLCYGTISRLCNKETAECIAYRKFL